MEIKIEESWKKELSDEFKKPYFDALIHFVKDEYKNHTVYPSGKLIFNAFDSCPFQACKVVILGQDPYHGPGQANGLSFSVNDGVPKPPSLLNIFKELHNDLGTPIPDSGNLERWAQQGVLLLNATLTVRAGEAGSHQKKGWEKFTDAVIQRINDQKEGVVFLLWGKYAQEKGRIIDPQKHHVLTATHPSPLAAKWGGWYGNNHFSKTNEYLRKQGQKEINW
jgi:uracil-DNA glycosylase